MFDRRSEKDLRRIQAFYDAVRARLEPPDPALFTAAPKVSAWSVGAHLYHIMRANGHMMKAIHRLATSVPPLPDEGPADRAARVILRLGRMPRGRAEAPAEVRPPEDLDEGTLTQSLAHNDRGLTRLLPFVDTLHEIPGTLPHPLLGPLNAVQWLGFVRIHSEHHLRIIEDIEAHRKAVSDQA